MAAAATVALLALPALASAHTEVAGSSPPDGARLAQAPSVIVVRYSAPLAEVVDASARLDGQDVTGGPPRLVRTDAARVRIPIDAAGRGGRLSVRWTVRSADAHLLEGAASFAVARPNVLQAVRRVAVALRAAAEELTAAATRR
ncbi:copper resistance CopC family protein [Miltoncostaea marina]|uniref:copper resistance CopC family protein n=1 Tax=Miltoncostaea marina TaxID=2843215 RepID=UPI001C3D6416|nr:copper resistance protein CopC [Miltoncostaea marina]